jgi:hypothetical protein
MAPDQYDLAVVAADGQVHLEAFLLQHPELQDNHALLVTLGALDIIGTQIVTARAMGERHIAEAYGEPISLH